MNEETKKRIETLLKENPVVVFVKGNPQGQMCGFSAQMIAILKAHKTPFTHHNVWEDHALWEGIKEYGNWPTIPQLYVNGTLIGGSDITATLAEQGELKTILEKATP